jgi:hypothetical protein
MPNRPGAPYRRQVATRPQSVRYGHDPGRRGRIADAAVTRRADGAAPDGKPPALFHTRLTQDVFHKSDHAASTTTTTALHLALASGALSQSRETGHQTTATPIGVKRAPGKAVAHDCILLPAAAKLAIATGRAQATRPARLRRVLPSRVCAQKSQSPTNTSAD